MAEKTVNKAYNDGVCIICREKAERSSFAAKRTPETAEDVEEIGALAFCEQSRRMQDSEYASQMGYKLDRKISVRRPGYRIDTKCSVMIRNMLYHISNVDMTADELYLHLTEVGEIA